MRAPSAPSFTKFHSAHLTRTAESSRNRGAGRRALPLNEFPSKQWARQRRAHSLYSIQPTRPERPNRCRTRKSRQGGCFLKMSSARKEGHLMWPSSCAGLFEILRKHPPCRGFRVPVYESDVLSNSLKSLGLPLPRLAFMHWPTKKPMTFWLPSRYCCACSAQFASTSSTIGCSASASLT